MRVYQVYDVIDPPTTDSFHRSHAAAKRHAATLVEPIILEHDVDTSKAGIIEALVFIPKRAGETRN
jgi:hypothetical protein